MKKSSRKIKNIIMIVVLALMLGASAFTVYFARKDSVNRSDVSSLQNEINDNRIYGNTPNSMPNDSTNGNQNQATPPNDNNTAEQGSSDESKTDEQSTNEKTTDSAIEQRPDNNINNNMPRGNDRRMPQQGRNDFNNTDFRKIKTSNVYSMLFGIEGLISALIIMYLIMSKFNKNDFKETLDNTDKIIIFIFGSIILTTILTKVFNIISII